MQTDVIHLMPFFSFFSEKRGLVAGKNREIWRSVFFCLFVCLLLAFVSCSLSSPEFTYFFLPFFFSKILHPPPSLHTKKERTSSQFRVFCPHCIAITPSTIVLLVGRGGGGDCIDVKTSNAYGLHRNYYK